MSHTVPTGSIPSGSASIHAFPTAFWVALFVSQVPGMSEDAVTPSGSKVNP